MKRLSHPIPANPDERCRAMPKPAPLLEEGCMSKMKEAPKVAVKQEAKMETREPKKKGLSAQQYAAILSFVMMVTAILSQASAIIGCTTSTTNAQQDAAPVVSTTQSFDKDDMQSNVSLPMIAPKPPMPDSVKPVPNPNSRLNQSLP